MGRKTFGSINQTNEKREENDSSLSMSQSVDFRRSIREKNRCSTSNSSSNLMIIVYIIYIEGKENERQMTGT